MSVKIEPIILSLYSIVKQYDSLVDVIYQNHKQKDIDEYYSFYESEFFGQESKKIEKEIKISLINASLYIYRNIIPILINANDLNLLYIKVKNKIYQYKSKWREQVETHLSLGNDKKYILNELKTAKDIEDKEYFIDVRRNKVREWENDKESLLSDFYYIDELRAHQIKLITVDEAIYILLKEIYEKNNNSFLNVLNFIKADKERNKKNKEGATVPDSMLKFDNLFVAGKKKITDLKYEEVEGQIYVMPNDSNKNVQLRFPGIKVRDENINIDFDYTKDIVTNTADDFKVLVGLLDIGQENLINGNEAVSFTMEELCRNLGYEPCTKNYNKIAKSIFYFKTKEVYIKISDTHVRIFNIIKTIDKPILNSDRKKQWRVYFHEELVQEIVASKYKRILVDAISSFRYELSVLLFKIFAYDFEKKSAEYIKYSWDELSQRTGLTNYKPSYVKNRLIRALDEMVSVDNSIILKYTTSEDKSDFYVYPKQKYLRKIP